MISWPPPFLPAVPGEGTPLQLHDTSSGELRSIAPGPAARLYVCGITPYDATHLGHAATYVAFDLVGRVLRDNGHDVHFTQNVTDIDDPLLERAERDGIEWRDLAAKEGDLFREDMTALQVVPPQNYVGVVEAMPTIADLVRRTIESGTAYELANDDAEGPDLYVDLSKVPGFGQVSGWSRDEMLAVFAERGGDPDRVGKRDALDPLLWRAAREGEPSWEFDGIPAGRPGWHVECTAIALDRLGLPIDVNGGGSDLIFPHHEMTVAQASAIGVGEYARVHAHAGMVGLDGHKMSKSRGNLVLVSRLRADGVDPMAIRLLLLAQHYRTDWDYTPELLEAAQARLEQWREALSVNAAPSTDEVVAAIRAGLSNDLDAPFALSAVDDWAVRTLTEGGDDPSAPGVLARVLDALLGVRI
ncbi:cysteine--1-D-myo-inosityl 2-amino-2-deoxy-alpha-D-glucopyranoside ligase [Knoellia sinensis KCTC 19936]|uniref:L-cysteine:1D-myo-inositol 2-amino-2-deoxy-alpha-D-glucopyranoside ligase n=1 Tax=Knoellia sinensis KCTC 19936 TaxID=1385520 RepID=A0A0A0J9D1_9MICO|nr:cysteine--1-D-myo-inosityl 2-amino-2-deoxy-alpha-D-glucopyranoside ligase [Knoellia sinensis]KGN32642.1 cysteine--1-D-myo-inosityl 2-amino-2-deoxy-alpha-D-glucopyranoside ligase [Knoellia sinensis KCTC 19936]